jgi:serine/threonine kinase PknH
VLYECLTGSSPYRADSAAVLVSAHLHKPIPCPSQTRRGISTAFDEVIARGMAKDPQDRYARAGDLGLAAYQALSAPDQNQAVTILNRSEQASPPPTDPGPPSAPPFAPADGSWPRNLGAPMAPQPADGGWPGQPGIAQAPQSAGGSWSGYAGTPQAPQSAGGSWPGYAGTPQAPQPVGPPAWTPPAPGPGKRNLWLILGAAALVVVVVGALSVWLIVSGSSPSPSSGGNAPNTPTTSTLPPVATGQLDSIMLSPAQVNPIMRATTMQPDRTIRAMNSAAFSSSIPSCNGTLYPVLDQVYSNSGYSAVVWQELHEPETNYDHVVDQGVVAFPSADQARQFVTNSAPTWQGCAGQTVSVTADNQTLRWTFAGLNGSAPTITQVHTTSDSRGGSCQHALSAVSNVVLEASACAGSVTDEASRMVQEMATNVRNATR